MTMSFDQAVNILRRGPQPGLQGDIEFRCATAVYSAHDEQRTRAKPGRMRFTDVAPRRVVVHDQPGVSGSEPMVRTENWTQGGAKPGSPAGAQLVQELPGPATAYFIANIGADKCGLFRSSDIEGVLNPGAGNTGAGLRQRLTADQRREIARDESWSRRTLQSINERNKEFWAKESAHG